MDTHTACLICQSTALKPLPEYKRVFLQQCDNCGFVFCAPIPTPEVLEAHYIDYPRHDYISPLTIQRYHQLLDEFEPYRQSNRIIDVGCGNGHFLKTAGDRGWQVYGTEYTDDAIRECENKNIKMQKGPLEPSNYEPGLFDVVTSFEVIEHINNPIDEMKKFYRILRPKGLVYLTTPNFNSLSRYYLKDKWTVIEYPEHLSYYTAQTLKRLFTKTGFKTKKVDATGISIGRIKEAKMESVLPDEPGSAQHTVRAFRTDDEKFITQAQNNPFLKFAVKSVNRALSLAKAGDTLKGYFIKQA